MSNQGKQASATTRYYLARLMDPDEVSAALEDLSDEERHRVGHRWILCCDVEPAMFARLRHQNMDSVAMRVTGFRSSTGVAYGVLTHQVADYQHRLLLPLYDCDVQKCILALEHEEFGFLMGNDRRVEALLLPSGHIAGRELQGLPGLHESLQGDGLRHAISELPAVISAVADPDCIPSLCDVAVRSVSLSMVMPMHSMVAIEDAFAGVS